MDVHEEQWPGPDPGEREAQIDRTHRGGDASVIVGQRVGVDCPTRWSGDMPQTCGGPHSAECDRDDDQGPAGGSRSCEHDDHHGAEHSPDQPAARAQSLALRRRERERQQRLPGGCVQHAHRDLRDNSDAERDVRHVAARIRRHQYGNDGRKADHRHQVDLEVAPGAPQRDPCCHQLERDRDHAEPERGTDRPRTEAEVLGREDLEDRAAVDTERRCQQRPEQHDRQEPPRRRLRRYVRIVDVRRRGLVGIHDACA